MSLIDIFDDFGSRKDPLRAPKERSLRNYSYRGRKKEQERNARGAAVIWEANAETAVLALDAVQKIVSALSDGRGGRYSVSFSGDGASTSLVTRNIRVTSKPLFDRNLKLRDVAIIMTGLAVHEIGHTWISEQTTAILNDRWPDDRRAHRMGNLLDDLRIETLHRTRFPGVVFAEKPTLKYIAKTARMHLKAYRHRPGAPVATMNFAIAATRYSAVVPWVADEATRRERAWWKDWASRVRLAVTDDEVAEGIAEGLARIEAVASEEPEGDPGPVDGGTERDEGDESETEGEDDKSEDDESEGDESEDEGDESDDDESEAEIDDDSEPETGDDPEPEPEGDSTTTSSSDEPGGEDDEVEDPTVDDFNEPQQGDETLDNFVQKARSIERVSMGDGFGSIKVTIE